MRGVKKSVMAIGLSLLGMACAHASVLYDWQPLANTDDFATTGGSLILSDAAFASGHAAASQSIDYGSLPGTASDRFADSDILRAQVMITSALGVAGDDFNIFANPRQGSDQNSPYYSLDSDISSAGNLLLGSLDLVTLSEEFHMTSDATGLWTVAFGSDATGGICNEPGRCSGATGRWELATQPAAAVPTPAAWPLFGLAIVGLFARKRRLI